MDKRFVLTSLFFISVLVTSSYAQQKRIMLFEDYTQGTVLMKNKSRTTTLLNYDAANRLMMYRQNDEEMILSNNRQVDTIYISSRKFIPIGPVYLEAVSVQNGIIYINWLLKNINRGKKGAYGMPALGKVETVNTREFRGGGTYDNEYLDIYQLVNSNEYWLLNSDKPVKCKNLKGLIKLFPEREAQIKDFVKKEKLDFTKAKDAIQVINYCLGL